MDRTKFSTDWPPDCPPDAASAPEGDYYRIVRTNPPTELDFRSHRELDTLPKAPPCLRAGLSTFRTVEDAERMVQLFPVLGSHIARGALDASYGLAMLTPGRQPTHSTVWPYEGVDRLAPFRDVVPATRSL